MRNLPAWLSAAVIILTASPCHARLGESIDQCVSRFGNPLHDDESKIGDRILSFQYKGFGIMITFRSGIVIDEAFVKLDKTAITDKELSILLDADSASMKWTETKPGMYKRDDGAFAILIANSMCLDISSKDSMPKGF